MSSKRAALLTVVAVLASVLVARAGEPKMPADDSPATRQFEFAERLYYTRLYRLAIPEYRKFRQAHADDSRLPTALFHLGQSLFHTDDYAGAARMLSELIEKFPDSPLNGPAYLARGQCRLLAGTVREGMEDLKKFLTLAPKPEQAAEAKYLLGRGYRLVKDTDSAATIFNDVAEHGPKASAYRSRSLFELAEIAIEKQQWEPALKLERRIAKEFPNDPLAAEAQLKSGHLLLKLQQYAEAEAAYAAVPETSALRAAGLLGAAQALKALDRCEEAIARCQQLLKQFADSKLVPQALYHVGACQLQRKQYDEAAKTFEGLAARFPTDEYGEKGAAAVVLAHYSAGQAQAEQTLASAAAYVGRYPTGPSIGQVRFFQGEAHLWQKHYDLAIQSYGAVPAGSSLRGEAQFKIAMAHELAGRPKKAATAYDAFLAAQPDHARVPQALYGAGAAYQRSRACNEAKARYDRLMQSFPKQPLAARALYETAMCDYMLSNRDATSMRPALESYLERHPEGADAGAACYWLGYAAQVEKDYKAALDYYGRAAGLPGPRAKQARLRIAETYHSQGDEAASAREFLSLIRNNPELVREEEYVYVGNYYHKQLEIKTSIYACQELLKRYPDTAWRDTALYRLGLLHTELPEPQWDAAAQYFRGLIAHYEAVQKKTPGAATPLLYPAKYELGRTLLAQGQPDRARPLLEETREKADTRRAQFSAQLLLANMDMEAGKLDKAKELFLPIGVLYDDSQLSAEALYKAGECLRLLGREGEGRLLWGELKRRYPKSPWAEKAAQKAGGQIAPVSQR